MRKVYGKALILSFALPIVIGCEGSIEEAFEYRSITQDYKVGPVLQHESYLFQQAEVPPLDVLFIIDDSGSMSDEQAKFRAGIANFVSQIREYDYRVGLTTTDPNLTEYDFYGDGVMRPVSGYLYGDAANPSGHMYFAKNDYATDAAEDAAFSAAINSISLEGHGDESGLNVMYNIFNDDAYEFFRSGSVKVIVIVSDEDECGLGQGTQSTRLAALKSPTDPTYVAGDDVSSGSTVQMPYSSSPAHTLTDIIGTTHTEYCTYGTSHPDAVYDFVDSLPDVQISRVKMFALVKNPVSASDQFYIEAVENFCGGSYVVDTTAPIEDVNTTVGDIDGNQAYYEAFLANVGAAAGAFTDSFQISTAADLPTDTADIKLFVDGVQIEPGASTYTINTGTTPVQIELEEAFQSSTSSANIVVRWQKATGTPQTEFGLSFTPDVSSISVQLNGVETNSYSYADGVITVPGANLNDTITISYDSDGGGS